MLPSVLTLHTFDTNARRYQARSETQRIPTEKCYSDEQDDTIHADISAVCNGSCGVHALCAMITAGMNVPIYLIATNSELTHIC